MKTYLFNHTSFETAYEVKNYPYGRLRTSMFYWIETVAKKGDRFCSCTINPKNGRINAPKKGTYSNIAVMYLDEKNHVTYDSVSIYTNRESLKTFAENVGENNLNPEQMKQLRQLRGEKIVAQDKITGDPLKDFSVKFEKNHAGDAMHEVRITFDRPDGVRVREMFEALKTVNQDKLKEVFSGDGIVRICIRGGQTITLISQDSYMEYLASDSQTDSQPMKKPSKVSHVGNDMDDFEKEIDDLENELWNSPTGSPE